MNKNNRPYGIAVFDAFMFHADATKQPKSTWLSQRFEKEEKNVDSILVAETAYGITDGVLWFKYKDRMWDSTHPENLPKFCLARTSLPYPLIFHINAMGIPCFPNPFAKQFSNDKKNTSALAASLGIPLPDAVFGRYDKAPSEFKMEYPFILKPSNSCEGRNVYKVINNETQYAAERNIINDNGIDNVIWQESMATGDDMRLYMFGTTPYYALIREASTFKANYENEPVVRALEIDELQEIYPQSIEYAINIMRHLPGETGFSSVDFLFDDSKGKREPVFGETSMGNLGTKLITSRKPQFLDDYLEYIYSKI